MKSYSSKGLTVGESLLPTSVQTALVLTYKSEFIFSCKSITFPSNIVLSIFFTLIGGAFF
jgi:hypothetical protein